MRARFAVAVILVTVVAQAGKSAAQQPTPAPQPTPAQQPPAAQAPPPQPAPRPTQPPPAPAPAPAARPQAPAPPAAADSSISGATISGANITGATVSGATISGATISGTTISGGTISSGTVSGGVISVGTISGGALLAGTISAGTISGGTISGGTLSGGTISGASLVGATISGATISAATISGKRPASPDPGNGRPTREAPPQSPAQPDRGKRSGAAPGKREPGTPADRTPAGDEEDEEELAARALERTLVQRGALILPPFALEIGLGVTYVHTSQDTVATIVNAGSAATIGVRRRLHQLSGSATARLGLPWDLQVEGSVPVERVWSDVWLAGATRSDSYGLGFGDPRFSLVWQAFRAGGSAWPDFLLTGTWKPQVGTSPFDATRGNYGLGAGYPSAAGTVTAVKAADPLVFVASGTYTKNFWVTTKDGRRKPGDSWGLGGGAILAVSPEASMSFLLDFHYKSEDTLAGKTVLASDETVAVLQIGVGLVASRRVLVNFTLGMGLTADSPDFQLGISAPVRF